MKRGFIDVGSKEGSSAESVGFVGRVEAARLPSTYDPCRDFEARVRIRGPNVAAEGSNGFDDAEKV